MSQVTLETKSSKAYLPQLLTFILVDEICSNYFLNIFTSLSTAKEFGFYLLFLVLQILFSPIQSGYSDFYCRKKSLVFSLLSSAVSVIPAFLYFQHALPPLVLLTFMTIIKGIFGNNLPLSWAGIADTQNPNVRFSLALSTSAIALGYLSLIALTNTFEEKTIPIIIFTLFILLSINCARNFSDIRDKIQKTDLKTKPSLKEDLSLIINNFLKSERFIKGILTFMLWEISFYSAHMLDVDLKIMAFRGLTLTMIIGYLFGVACMWKLSRKSDDEMIKIGIIISTISFIPIFVFYPFLTNTKQLIISCYFFYAFGAAFLAPSLFSTISKERQVHEQGKIYGLLDSTDTFAFLVATILTAAYYWWNLSQITVVLISFFTFIISLWPYAKFKKSSRPLK